MEKLCRRKFDYKWVIIAASFVMVFITLGFCSSTKKLFLKPVTEALGILRSVYSINDSLRYITTSIVNLFFGALVMRFGPRKLIGFGFLTLIGSMLLYSFATHIAIIYAGGVLLGIGLTMTTTTMVGYIVSLWYPEKRGTIMGAILCANGIGGAVATKLLAPIIRQDFRAAYRLVAIILLVVGILVVVLFRNAPEERPLPPQGGGKKKVRGNVWSGITFREALRRPYFYSTSVCIFLTGLCLQSAFGVDGAHMSDAGIDESFVASAVSVASLMLAACKFLVGACYDRKGLRFTMLVCDIAAVFMMLMLALVANSSLGRGFAMGYAVISALALPLETIMLPLIASDLFGEKEYGKLLGVFVSVSTAGYACGPILTNLAFDRLGTYKPILLLYTGIMAAITALFLLCQRQADKLKKEIALRESADESAEVGAEAGAEAGAEVGAEAGAEVGAEAGAEVATEGSA